MVNAEFNTDALKNKRYAEAIKAIVSKMAFEGEVEGGKAEEAVVRLEAEMAKVPAEMKPMMEAILAHWYAATCSPATAWLKSVSGARP